MFEALGRFTVRRHRLVLLVISGVATLAAVLGAGLFGVLAMGGFDLQGADSTRAAEQLRSAFGYSDLDLIAVFRSPQWAVSDPAFGHAVDAALHDVSEDIAPRTVGWRAGLPDMVSTDQHAAAVIIQLAGRTDSQKLGNFRLLRTSVRSDQLEVGYGGMIAIIDDAVTHTKRDLVRAEIVSMILLFVLLLVIFRSMLAALLPLTIGLVTMITSFGLLRVVAQLTDISIFSVNIVTVVTLGLSVDYALFIVTRFREERAGGAGITDAIVATMGTAGRTVFFSGITVCLVAGSLMLFPVMFLRSAGLGAVIAVAFGLAITLTLLPALLLVLGDRLESMPVRRSASVKPVGEGGWARIGRAVTRRPVLFLSASVALLVLLSVPFLHVTLGSLDHRTLPADAASRRATESLRQDFPNGQLDHILVVATADSTTTPAERGAALTSWTRNLRALPGVRRADVVARSGPTALVLVTHPGEPEDPSSRALVRTIRQTAAPGMTTSVGGPTAVTVDLLDTIGGRLPLVAALICGTIFLLLFLAFGSIVVPIKAIACNVVSIGASLGAITWIFQDGHLAGLLRFTPLGYVEVSQPVLTLALLFALSMDYELFLLSRVKEHYDRSGDNTEAIVVGLQRSGFIITSAALTMLAVIVAFSTSSILAVKEVSIGMLVAVALDATVVRMVLVPATLRLLGRANWWPQALRRRRSGSITWYGRVSPPSGRARTGTAR